MGFRAFARDAAPALLEILAGAGIRSGRVVDLGCGSGIWAERLVARGYEVLGITLPYVEMPVGPGRNLSVLIEVAARNHLLKLKGFHPARALAPRLGERIQASPLPEGAPMSDREPGDGEA